MKKVLSAFLLGNLTVLAQSQPAMVQSNKLNEVEVRVRKQRAGIQKLKAKDTKRKEDNNFRSGRKTIRNNSQIRTKIQTKIDKETKISKKEKPLKKMIIAKKNRDKKIRKASKFRQKDSHVTKSGSKGFIFRKARRSIPGNN